MKVYIIKSKQTKEYQTVVMDFIPDIRQSDIFIDYEVALAYCPSDCEVVECELMEKTELADYTKQVRKDVIGKVRDIARKIARPTTEYDGGEFDYDIDGVTLDNLLMWFEDEEFDLLKIFLDQIQGEKK